MPDPFSALTTMGITTVDELQALVALFGHQQREPQEEIYQTKISPQDEDAFRLWLVHEGVPFDPNQRNPDYDMRGYWESTVKRGIEDQQDKATGYFPDTWKTPFHRSFSNESIYAPMDAPHWEGKKLIDKHGELVYNEDDPEDLLPRAADNLMNKDQSTGLVSGKRNARPNYRP